MWDHLRICHCPDCGHLAILAAQFKKNPTGEAPMTSDMTPAYTALTDILQTRRSIRSFTDEPIDDDCIRLLAAATASAASTHMILLNIVVSCNDI
jgi:hypothetical protein